MSSSVDLKPSPFGIEGVVSCGWKNSELMAVLEGGEGGDQQRTLTCGGVEYLLFLEEAVADRTDLLIKDGHVQALPHVRGLYVSASSQLLQRLKIGETFGEYVNFGARHYIVQAPYNSFEFIAFGEPVVT